MLESSGVYGIDEIITNCKGEGQPPAGYYTVDMIDIDRQPIRSFWLHKTA